MRWFRFYHEALDDPKVQLLSDRRYRQWVNLLCLASQNDPRGSLPDLNGITFRLRLSQDEANVMLDEFVELTLLDMTDDGWVPHNWNVRQRASDNVATRVTAHRERQESNVTVTLHETPVKRSSRARSDTDTDTDTEAERKPARVRAVVVNTELPYPMLQAFLQESEANLDDVKPQWEKLQLAVAKRLLAAGYTTDQVRGCTHYMHSEAWRTSPMDLFQVEKFIGKWAASGSPETEPAPRRREPEGVKSTAMRALINMPEQELQDALNSGLQRRNGRTHLMPAKTGELGSGGDSQGQDVREVAGRPQP